jgi:hypothetical protein
LNFIFGIVCLFVCVCAFSLRRESPDMILGDKPLIFEVVLSQLTTLAEEVLHFSWTSDRPRGPATSTPQITTVQFHIKGPLHGRQWHRAGTQGTALRRRQTLADKIIVVVVPLSKTKTHFKNVSRRLALDL